MSYRTNLPHQILDSGELLHGRFFDACFEGIVATDELVAVFGQACPATALATFDGFDNWLTETLIERIDEQPCPLVGESHCFGRCTDGLMLTDIAQQFDLAGADSGTLPELEPGTDDDNGG